MFLIDKFQQFYGEVLRVKERVGQGTWVFEGDAATAARAASESSPSAVWRRLTVLLERQALEASREGGDFALEIYRRAQYAMAAIADETFLHLDWVGRDAWREHLLETKLFNSHRAGEEVFERIEELLRNRDSLYGELARIYLMILALGFQGKFRGQPDAEQDIDGYRRRLHRFIYGRDPQAVRGNEQLAPAAYASTLDEGRSTELPYLRPWIWSMVAIVVIWIAASHFMWQSAVRPLEPLVDRILDDRPATHAPATTTVGRGQQP